MHCYKKTELHSLRCDTGEFFVVDLKNLRNLMTETDCLTNGNAK